MRRVFALLTVALAVLVVAACANNDKDSHSGHPTKKVEETAEFNSADVSFATDMIVHHEQAIQLADIILRNGSGALDDLAKRIKDAQNPEIETMRGWLIAWEQPTPGTNAQAEHAQMPGMASAVSIDELRTADGERADQLFATLMTAHHEGAIEMAEMELSDGKNGDAKKLAEEIISAQQSEIDEMKPLVS